MVNPLLSTEISKMLMTDCYTRNSFMGVFPQDYLPCCVSSYPAAYVCNTHKHTQEGEHWVGMFFEGPGAGEYFDPLGLPPIYKSWEKFMDTSCSDWTFNNKTIQSVSSNACGYHVVHYLLLKARGCSLARVLEIFQIPGSPRNDAKSVLKVVEHYQVM